MGRPLFPAFARPLLALGAAAAALLPLAAAAQSTSAPPIRDRDMPAQGPYPRSTQGVDAGPPPEPPMPSGYDGRQAPPPPPGYQQGAESAQDRAADERYAWEAERWARANCVKSQGDVGAGMAVGGMLGAIVGSGIAGRGSHGAGAAVGAILGAGTGAAVASSSGGETSPGCPPGYVVRRGAPAYAYAPPDYYYGAPGWYRPWLFIDGFWAFRPYPYHVYYWRTYRYPAFHGYYGRPVYGWRGGGHWGGWHRHR